MLDLGVVKPGATIRIPFSTFDKDDGSSITMTNFAVADILIYKDGGTTERASTSGFTATTDFDSKTGKHLIVIDLSDNTTADFFQAGSEYLVAIDAVTVDAVTVGAWVARFRIGYRSAILDTFIATLTSQTSFTLNSGPAEDDALNGLWAIIHDAASAVQWSWVQILDYTGSTKTVTLVAGATFTVAAKDNISVMFPAPLQPTVTGRTVNVGTDNNAQADAAKINGVATTSVTTVNANIGTTQPVNFTGTSASALVKSDMVDIAGAAVNTSSAQLGVNVVNAAGTAWNSGAIGASTLASDTIAAAKIASGAITAAKFAAGAIDAAALATDAAQEIRNAITGGAYALDTDSNGRIRIVDGTGAGELDTSSGVVIARDHTGAALATAASIAALNNLSSAQAQAASESALQTYHLDHFIAAADPGSVVADSSFLAKLVSKSATPSFASYNNQTDSHEALRDRGDAAWVTATGFSTHTAADVWAVATRVLTAGTNIALAKGTGVTGFNDIAAADVWAAGTRTLTGLGFTLAAADLASGILTSSKFAADSLTASAMAPDMAQEIRNAVTGGAWSLDTDANGRVRIVDGTAAGELDTASGLVKISGALQTLDALNTSLVAEHDATQALVAASAIRTAVGLASANLDNQLDGLPTAAENAAALLDLTDGIETGITPRKLFRGLGAALFGLVSGAGTGTEVFKGAGQGSGGTTRLTYSVDGSGNRTAVTLNL